MFKFLNILITIYLFIPNLVWSQKAENKITSNNIKYDLSIRLNTAFSLGIEG